MPPDLGSVSADEAMQALATVCSGAGVWPLLLVGFIGPINAIILIPICLLLAREAKLHLPA